MFVRRYDSVPIDIKQVVRYLGYGKEWPDASICMQIDAYIQSFPADYKVCAEQTRVTVTDDTVFLDGFMPIKSRMLAECLSGCDEAVVFGATIGTPFDRLLKKTEVLSMSKAVLLQAVGSAAIEGLCDLFCESFGEHITDRFSPGYGDLPIETQENIFNALQLGKNIGMTRTDSFIMLPIKSVTAFFGIRKASDEKGHCGGAGCRFCALPNCVYRKEE